MMESLFMAEKISIKNMYVYIYVYYWWVLSHAPSRRTTCPILFYYLFLAIPRHVHIRGNDRTLTSLLRARNFKPGTSEFRINN